VEIGVPREIKDGERRVGMTPEGVGILVVMGHRVRVESGAGAAVGFNDADFRAAGAQVESSPDAVWRCELVVKVKEIQPQEYPRLTRGTTVFGFAQLNRDPDLARAVLAAGVRVIGYETVRGQDGGLPLLAPMSRIAGRLAPLVGAIALTGFSGGSGVLLPGVDAIPAGRVVVIGAGNVGRESARVAARLGCSIAVFSRREARAQLLARTLVGEGARASAHCPADPSDPVFTDAIADADLVIGGVLEPGQLSPKLIPRALVASMRPGSVIVDVGIDQGGIAATSRMTKLSQPTYVEEGVVHYAVPNMPSLVARTATLALTAATLPYVRCLAGRGVERALAEDEGLRAAVMTADGCVVHSGLAADLRLARTANRP
jgi:alanine dehydrogenase